jgi:hypothetical protein
MVLEGLDVNSAMEEVLKVRSIAFSAEGWRDFSRDVLETFSFIHKKPANAGFY